MKKILVLITDIMLKFFYLSSFLTNFPANMARRVYTCEDLEKVSWQQD